MVDTDGEDKASRGSSYFKRAKERARRPLQDREGLEELGDRQMKRRTRTGRGS